jgi:hypothetical protein
VCLLIQRVALQAGGKVQMTRDLYQAFKKHVEDQDAARVERLRADAAAAAAADGAPAGKPLKVTKPPPLGRVLAHVCHQLEKHAQGSEENQAGVLAAFRDFQLVRCLPVVIRDSLQENDVDQMASLEMRPRIQSCMCY